MTKSKVQAKGVRYKEPQKTVESKDEISAISSRDSKIHSFDPSSFTYDHHLNPTRSLPETFFTVQKSKANKMIHRTKIKIKEEVNQDPKIYNPKAKDLNNK